jgi:competence protein ComEA
MLHLTRQETRVIYSFLAILLLGISIVGVKQWVAGRDSFFHQARQTPVSFQNHRELMVFVKGAVKYPGVYNLPVGSRILEAVQKATPKEDADILFLELAEFVRDGQTIEVPLKAEADALASQTRGVEKTAAVQDLKVNLNTADITALDNLPGIGPGLAARIIEFRQKRPFASVEDLYKVGGIGQKKFDQIKDKVTVE